MASGLPQRPTIYIFQQPLRHTLALYFKYEYGTKLCSNLSRAVFMESF